GALIPGADSHSRAYGAYGALGYGVGSTTLGFGWATGYVYFTVAKQRRVVFTGKLQPWVSGKDVVLALLARWGQKQAQGMSVEFVDVKMQLPMSYRNTIANMMAEGEALNGIFAPDDLTYAWYREKGATDLPYPRFAPGADARDIEKTDPRLGGESIADVFRAAGAEIRESWCGPCFGQGPDALKKGESAITSFNRNWTNRMGVGGLGYLASPAVVASSALLG